MYKYIDDPKEIADIISQYNKQLQVVTLDTETTGVDPSTCTLLDIQMMGYSGDVYMFPATHALLLNELKTTQVWWNFKYDWHVLLRHGVDFRNREVIDGMLLSHLYDETRDSHSLSSWCKELYNDEYKDEFWAKYDNYEAAPFEERLQYACHDVERTAQVVRYIESKHFIPKSLIDSTHNLAKALLDTEIRGLSVDKDYLLETGKRVKSRLDALKPEMLASVVLEVDNVELSYWIQKQEKLKTPKGKLGVPRPTFNFDSSKQLMSLLYDELDLPVQKNSKTKQISVDYDSLERLRDKHPIIPLIQEHREHQKVYTTYIEGTIAQMKGNKVYPSFDVNGTVTGRISHSKPNLAQLPKKGGVRGIYVPEPGYMFIAADYSQLEVCIEANLTKDPNLIKIFKDNMSKHDITAKELGVDRDTAKTLNFALQYWCTHFKVAKLLGISEKEGLKVYNRYWEIYKGAKQLKDATDKEVDDVGYVTNLVGRTRHFGLRKRTVWDGDYRQAYNFKVQGPGADFTNMAFANMHSYFKYFRYGDTVISVHDEIIVSSKIDKVKEVETTLVRVMEDVGMKYGLEIPLKAESGGPMNRWLDK